MATHRTLTPTVPLETGYCPRPKNAPGAVNRVATLCWAASSNQPGTKKSASTATAAKLIANFAGGGNETPACAVSLGAGRMYITTITRK